jgi:hypothetical protein
MESSWGECQPNNKCCEISPDVGNRGVACSRVNLEGGDYPEVGCSLRLGRILHDSISSLKRTSQDHRRVNCPAHQCDGNIPSNCSAPFCPTILPIKQSSDLSFGLLSQFWKGVLEMSDPFMPD